MDALGDLSRAADALGNAQQGGSGLENESLFVALQHCEAARNKIVKAMYARRCSGPKGSDPEGSAPAKSPADSCISPTRTNTANTSHALNACLFGVLRFLSSRAQCDIITVSKFCHECASNRIIRLFKRNFPDYDTRHPELENWTAPRLTLGVRSYYLHMFRTRDIERLKHDHERSEQQFNEEEGDGIRQYKLRRALLFHQSRSLLSLRLMSVESGSGDGFMTITYDLETDVGSFQIVHMDAFNPRLGEVNQVTQCHKKNSIHGIYNT